MMALNIGSETRTADLPVERLNDLLWQSLGNGLKLSHVKWKHLTDPGENFGSLILAVDADITRNGNTETLHIVVKLPPRSAYLLDLFNSTLTFKKELSFYNDVVPAFKDLQMECGFQQEDLISLVPRFFGGRLGLKDPNTFDEQAAIVMENLTYSGYSVRDRISGLDKVHTEFAVKELARLHAITICLKMRKPQFFENTVLPALVPPANEAAQQGVLDMVQRAHADLKRFEEAKPYLDSIEKTIQRSLQCDDCGDKAEEPWATLVHNDFWVNNMMFQYKEDGSISNMKIVDFQLCIYDYGVKDLIFFLLSSAKKEVIDNYFDDMIDLYYEFFIKSLSRFKIDTARFPKSKFISHLNHCAPLKFGQCIMMVQVIQATRGSAPKMENIKTKDVFLSLSGDDKYKEKLLHILFMFDKKGWLVR